MRLYDYVASGNCYKARLLLAQLERSYERVAVDIFAGDTLAEDFAAKNPARTTPVLETDDGRYLQESNAILWYLADGTELLPDDPLDRAHVLRWLIIEQTDVMPGIGGFRFRLITRRWRADDPQALRRRELGVEALRMLEEHLAERSSVIAVSYGSSAFRSSAHSAKQRSAVSSLPRCSSTCPRLCNSTATMRLSPS